MPNHTCCALGCANRAGRDDVKFYSFPSAVAHQGARRQAWIRAVNRANWLPNKFSRLCSVHFAGGQKSDVPGDPAYIPTIFQYNKKIRSRKKIPKRTPTNDLRDQGDSIVTVLDSSNFPVGCRVSTQTDLTMRGFTYTYLKKNYRVCCEQDDEMNLQCTDDTDDADGDRNITVSLENVDCKLLETLRGFWMEGKLCDVELRMQDGSLRAHKAVLSSFSEQMCGVFCGMPQTSALTFHFDIDKESIRKVLTLLYGEQLLLDDSSVNDVMKAARMMGVESIAQICEMYIGQRVTSVVWTNRKHFIMTGNSSGGTEAVKEVEMVQDADSQTVPTLLRQNVASVRRSEYIIPPKPSNTIAPPQIRNTNTLKMSEPIKLENETDTDSAGCMPRFPESEPNALESASVLDPPPFPTPFSFLDQSAIPVQIKEEPSDAHGSDKPGSDPSVQSSPQGQGDGVSNCVAVQPQALTTSQNDRPKPRTFTNTKNLSLSSAPATVQVEKRCSVCGTFCSKVVSEQGQILCGKMHKPVKYVKQTVQVKEKPAFAIVNKQLVVMPDTLQQIQECASSSPASGSNRSIPALLGILNKSGKTLCAINNKLVAVDKRSVKRLPVSGKAKATVLGDMGIIGSHDIVSGAVVAKISECSQIQDAKGSGKEPSADETETAEYQSLNEQEGLKKVGGNQCPSDVGNERVQVKNPRKDTLDGKAGKAYESRGSKPNLGSEHQSHCDTKAMTELESVQPERTVPNVGRTNVLDSDEGETNTENEECLTELTEGEKEKYKGRMGLLVGKRACPTAEKNSKNGQVGAMGTAKKESKTAEVSPSSIKRQRLDDQNKRLGTAAKMKPYTVPLADISLQSSDVNLDESCSIQLEYGDHVDPAVPDTSVHGSNEKDVAVEVSVSKETEFRERNEQLLVASTIRISNSELHEEAMDTVKSDMEELGSNSVGSVGDLDNNGKDGMGKDQCEVKDFKNYEKEVAEDFHGDAYCKVVTGPFVQKDFLRVYNDAQCKTVPANAPKIDDPRGRTINQYVQCKFCDVKWKRVDGCFKAFLDHVSRVHKMKLNLQCKLCSAVVKQQSGIVRHALRCHGLSDYIDTVTVIKYSKFIHCGRDNCDYKVATSEFNHRQLFMHRYYKHGVAVPDWVAKRQKVCPHCGYACLSQLGYDEHVRSHTGEKPIMCEECGLSFSRIGTLKKHKKYRHTKEKKYKCTKCDYASATKEGLQVHDRKHTGDRPHKCTECTYASTTRGNLRVHMKKHHDIQI